jgi:mannitol/fructose-specific phosphotransferase system IIA component (Ntr-type)
VFAADLIKLELSATDKIEAIRELANLAVTAGRGTNADEIVDDVLARDKMGTPQFDGVAIPHARTGGIRSATVLIGRSSSGVVFDPEEPSADLIFMILVPKGDSDEYITILSRLSRRLMDPAFTVALRNSATSEELVAVLENGDKQ